MKKLMYLAVICLPLLFISCEKRIIDTSVTIYGTVVDAETNASIAGAHVSLTPSSKDCFTDDDGIYRFSDVAFNSKGYTLRVKKTGYREGTQNIHLDPGEWESVSFRLEKEK